MVLPGKMAKEIRSQFAEIIEDYIRKNLSGSSFDMAESDPSLVGFKRRREELELLKLEEEIKGMAQTRVMRLQDKLEQIRDTEATKLDERTRLMFQDAYTNMLLNSQSNATAGGQALLTNGLSPNAPISISSVASKLGYRPTTTDSKRIGVDIKNRYIKLHSKPPAKHDQLCDGRVTLVNSYTEQDRPLVEEALHTYFRPSSDSDGEGDA